MRCVNSGNAFYIFCRVLIFLWNIAYWDHLVSSVTKRRKRTVFRFQLASKRFRQIYNVATNSFSKKKKQTSSESCDTILECRQNILNRSNFIWLFLVVKIN